MHVRVVQSLFLHYLVYFSLLNRCTLPPVLLAVCEEMRVTEDFCTELYS